MSERNKIMALDIQQLLTPMLNAAKAVIRNKWPGTQNYAETEFKKIGQNILDIEKNKLQGKYSEDQARLLFAIQKNATKSVLLALEGMTLIMTEQAINAALGAIRDVVNKAIGFGLI
jgi:hypothetical protein